MYDIRQFKPTLYLLMLLGIAGFALAVDSPGVLILGWAATLINAWLVRTGRFRPISRLISNLILLAGLPVVLIQSFGSAMNDEVVWIGQYIVLLQVVKLYEQRANRDYAQLLVLGLLLMVAAAINTTSLAFGVILIFYLFLSLYCCLLFYLKSETDAAITAMSLPHEKLSSSTLRQDQRYLTRSMRRIAGLVAAVAIFFAVAVFLFFPRSTGSGFFGGRQTREQAVTGFSSEVSFQQVARIAQSNEIVAYARIWKNDQPVAGTDTLLLRGMTLERYNGGAENARGQKWEWNHERIDEVPHPTDNSAATSLRDDPVPPGIDLWRQNITLRPTGTPVLFALAGPISIRTQRHTRVDFSPASGTMRSPAAMMDTLNYEVVSTNNLELPPDTSTPALMFPSPDEQILAFARRPEVSGSNAAGSLAGQRHSFPGNVDPLDGEIAANIEKYLRTHFTYTLDLTDARRIEGRDPIVAFLYDLKRGHCEYFAGAMTLMCQSLGMQARMVVGYKCDEYSAVGDQYIVRQSQAHSWVEVRSADGWKTFDPTSGTPADLASRFGGRFWQPLEHVVDYLQFAYASRIIAYDNEDRKNLIETAESAMSRATADSRSFYNQVGEWNMSVRFWKISSTVIGAIVWLAILAVLAAVAAFLTERWRLRRRAARIGIDSLPAAEQQRLARQLLFYDNLIRLLGRHQMVRPPHLTPLEFVESLLFLPTDIYRTILRLTRLFYRVRFGGDELSAGQRKRLETVLMRLGNGLSGAMIARR
jgi:transglutaminase-like putative cysteine protease